MWLNFERHDIAYGKESRIVFSSNIFEIQNNIIDRKDLIKFIQQLKIESHCDIITFDNFYINVVVFENLYSN